MATIARDPSPPSPTLPPGGTPRLDEEWHRWCQGFVEQVNDAWSFRFYPELPHHPNKLLTTYQLTGHLYKWLLGGGPHPTGKVPTYRWRLRFVAIQFDLRPTDLKVEAERYASILEAEAVLKLSSEA